MRSIDLLTRGKAYTLLEVLVVVVLMGLLAASILPALASTTDTAKRDQLLDMIVHLDVQARQLAQQGRRCMLRWDQSQRTIGLIDQKDSEQIVQVIRIPESIEFGSLSDDRIVEFNTFGQSRNYGYSMSASGWSARIEFNGLSGWYTDERDEQ